MDKENKNEQKRYHVPIAQKALIYDDNTKKFLLLKAKNPQEYFLKHFGRWEFAGGRLEDNETLEAGLEREIREEIGDVDFEMIGPVSVKKVSLDVGNIIMIDYLIMYKGGEIELSDEHEEFRWETLEEIEKNNDYHDWVKRIIKKAKERIDEGKYLESWKRCQADFENYKKRQNDNQKEIVYFANMNLIREILPVLDNFYASTGHIPEDQKNNAWVTGIMHIQRQLSQVLADNGVEEIETKIGDDFNPSIHEAIQKVTGDKVGAGKIEKIIQKGYEINGRLIRPAKVTVK